MRTSTVRAVLAPIAVASAALMAGPATAQQEMCLECFSIRVGPAMTVRGPFPDELDAPFAAHQLSSGMVRGFSANGTTYAIDGNSIWDMRGERKPVMPSGESGKLNECGRWLTSIVEHNEQLIGMVHQEAICNYGPNGQTHKSMAIALSDDEGLTWKDLGTVITGLDAPTPGTTTGEGDCTMVNGADGYLYAYCQRNSDWQNYVARAPLSDPTAWRKYYSGGWNEPGLEGRADAIGFFGVGAAMLEDYGAVALVATDPWAGGIRLSISQDKLQFRSLVEPLVIIDGSEWERPAATGLAAYPVLLDADSGSNAIRGRALLSYVYVPPHLGFEDRYLVLQEVTISPTHTPQAWQVGVALTRWQQTDTSRFITTTGPIASAGSTYSLDAVVAYAMTAEPVQDPAIKIVDCVLETDTGLSQALAQAGDCAALGLNEYRSVGWLFRQEQEGTVPVYRCAANSANIWFGSREANCEGRGVADRLLGYGLAS